MSATLATYAKPGRNPPAPSPWVGEIAPHMAVLTVGVDVQGDQI
jgi:hypothetical protein